MKARIAAFWEDLIVSRRKSYLGISAVIVVILLFLSVVSYMVVEWRALFAARDPLQRLTAEQFFEARNRLFTTAVGLIGAVGLLGTLFFTWRNFLLAESGQITDRFAKAVEMLGAVRDVGEGRVQPNIEARIGAIYALERIAYDSERDHWPVMEVLSAYVRNAPIPHLVTGLSQATGGGAREWESRPDVQAALVVIGRRRRGERREGNDSVDLRGAHLEGTEWSGHFEHVYFAGAHLNAADLSGARMARAIFKRADLSGADLYETDLQGADFEGSKLERAILVRACMVGASLRDGCMEGAILDDAVMDGIDFLGVQGLTQSQLDSTASYKGERNLPSHLEPDARGNPDLTQRRRL